MYIADLAYKNNISDDIISNNSYEEQLNSIKTLIIKYTKTLKEINKYLFKDR